MVNDAETGAERAFSPPPGVRDPGLAALLALDARLGEILRTTREPMVGQMRLTWWHTALAALDEKPAPAEPVLRALAAAVLPRGVTGAALAGMIDGWEVLLDEGAPGDDAMATFAAGRGRGLFDAAATVLGANGAGRAGEAWALADLAANLSDPAGRARAREMAEARYAGLFRPRWQRAARPLGVLTIAAILDMRGVGGAARGARLVRHVLTGG